MQALTVNKSKNRNPLNVLICFTVSLLLRERADSIERERTTFGFCLLSIFLGYQKTHSFGTKQSCQTSHVKLETWWPLSRTDVIFVLPEPTIAMENEYTLEELTALAQEKIDLGTKLLQDLAKRDTVDGVRKISKKISQELKFLNKVSEPCPTMYTLPIPFTITIIVNNLESVLTTSYFSNVCLRIINFKRSEIEAGKNRLIGYKHNLDTYIIWTCTMLFVWFCFYMSIVGSLLRH